MIINKLNSGLLVATCLWVTAGCSSNARFHEIQSARLDECNYKADKEYYECLKQQEANFEKFKKQQAANSN